VQIFVRILIGTLAFVVMAVDTFFWWKSRVLKGKKTKDGNALGGEKRFSGTAWVLWDEKRMCCETVMIA
jgi:hypothetical protein